MSDLLTMSFDGLVSPSITLSATQPNDGSRRSGWGFAWYPADEYAAQVVKDPFATGETAMTGVLRDWERFRSSVFVCHVRGAAQIRTLENTQPFSRSYGGRDWVLAHRGNLDSTRARKLLQGQASPFVPVGHTDTEHAFCWLLRRAFDAGASHLADIGWPTLKGWFHELNRIGSASFVLTDGLDLIVYRDEDGANDLYVRRLVPPHGMLQLANATLRVDFDDPQDVNRTMILVAGAPLSADWQPLEPGQMFAARKGAVTWTNRPLFELADAPSVSGSAQNDGLHTSQQLGTQPRQEPAPNAYGPPSGAVMIAQCASAMTSLAEPPPPTPGVGISVAPATADSDATESSILRVTHETIYRYSAPVEKSVSTLRLHPVQDGNQEILDHDLHVSAGALSRYEDVFGNDVSRLEVNASYSELRIVSQSRLRVSANINLLAPRVRTTLPLVWMPWQRQMMIPYLLPPELPESQLEELNAYAMSFVERQDYDLVETLLDINRTIRRDFAYVSNSTHLGTTPFDVYVHRRGVCQDFANLFICLARLLSVPARYRVGYICTGTAHDNQIQSEASHAWAEVYLPTLGWRGFDPTNGCLAGLDHVRVAAGRNYRDATPTSGTIFKGGGHETLEVNVHVKPEV